MITHPGQMRLYDTRLRAVTAITPSTAGRLSVYACGPTVYKPQHVGNLRSSLLPDLIGRLARLHGLEVSYVQNITDVGHLAEDTHEDKVIAQAQARGLTPLQIAREIEELFHADGAALNLMPALANPRASDYVTSMVKLTAQLIGSGHAYVSGGSVWFDATSDPSYGAISGNRVDDVNAGASGRISTSESDVKRFHADWALWRGAVPTGDADELIWESPWGPGTPGWHIECSAMSRDLLGDRIDIHTGGIDLRFPHHENERAQSNATGGHELVTHWVHGEHLLFDGRKMAKSTGNVVLLSDVVTRGLDPLSVRYAFLTSRYRTQANLSWDALRARDIRLRRWRERAASWRERDASADLGWVRERTTSIVDAFDDDLDTPKALALLEQVGVDDSVPDEVKLAVFTEMDLLFGLDLTRPVETRSSSAGSPSVPAAAARLVERRERARAERNWALADELRGELAALGVNVADTPAGPVVTLR